MVINFSKTIWTLGSAIMILLGVVHLYLTFLTEKFHTSNTSLENAMRTTSPNLTDKITFWSGWEGFNASHSCGIIFIGLINIYLIYKYFETLQWDHFYFILNICTIAVYLFLANRFWFNIPLFGLGLTMVCYLVSYIFILYHK